MKKDQNPEMLCAEEQFNEVIDVFLQKVSTGNL